MALEKGLVDVLDDRIDYKLLTVFTSIPAIVTSVNYDENHVNAQPLIKTKFSDGSQLASPELFHVPIFILSAGQGSARVTLPVKVGDTVLVMFSQRDHTEFYGSNGKTQVDAASEVTHSMYPILALPGLFTKASAKTLDSTNIIVENGSTKLTVAPSGNITADCPNLIVNGNLTVNGDVAANGSSLTHNGTDVGDTHTHGGVLAGGSNTAVPN
jgi:phage baseplate assembly protein gpV